MNLFVKISIVAFLVAMFISIVLMIIEMIFPVFTYWISHFFFVIMLSYIIAHFILIIMKQKRDSP